MLLTVLGCWAPYPRAGGACSGYLLQEGGVNVLLEAGNGSFSRLCEYLDFRLLNAVVISHLHPDHFVDLYCLRHAVEGARRDGLMRSPLPLYLPRCPREIYEKLSAYEDAFSVTAIEELPVIGGPGGVECRYGEIEGLVFYFIPARHSLYGFSMAVQGGASRLVFSGDTAPNPALSTLAQEADLFLCEASGLDGDRDYLCGVHMTARQAGEVAHRSRVRRLLITHFWPEYPVAKLVEQAVVGFGESVEAAVEGKTYEF